jgi:hypothetical protein
MAHLAPLFPSWAARPPWPIRPSPRRGPAHPSFPPSLGAAAAQLLASPPYSAWPTSQTLACRRLAGLPGAPRPAAPSPSRRRASVAACMRADAAPLAPPVAPLGLATRCQSPSTPAAPAQAPRQVRAEELRQPSPAHTPRPRLPRIHVFLNCPRASAPSRPTPLPHASSHIAATPFPLAIVEPLRSRALLSPCRCLSCAPGMFASGCLLARWRSCHALFPPTSPMPSSEHLAVPAVVASAR